MSKPTYLPGVLAAVCLLAMTVFADVPGLINYQGELTDAVGDPVSGSKVISFSICADEAGTLCVWSESQTVIVTDGHFSVMLGTVTPLTDVVFEDSIRWLGINVDGEIIEPHIRLVTAPYAFRVSTVDSASGGTIKGDLSVTGKVTIGTNHTNTGDYAFVAGYANSVTGEGGTITGGRAHTVGSQYATVSGGYQHTASADYATVGGGRVNQVSGTAGTIAGGWVNNVSGYYSGILGGAENTVGEWFSVIGGGSKNAVLGEYSAILGGISDTITSTAHHSYLFGIESKLTQDSTFMVDMPHIRFGDETTGYEFPPVDGSSGQVLATNGTGQLSWTTGGSGGGGGWTDDGAVVRLDTDGDVVGVGTLSPKGKLHVEAEQYHAGYFESNTGYNDSGVVHAEFTGTGDVDAVAVYGSSQPNDFWGIGGRFEGNYLGVEGNSIPLGTDPNYAYIGVVGTSAGGIARNEGVRGVSRDADQVTGVYGTAARGDGFAIGVYGNVGLDSSTSSTGVMGTASGTENTNYGVFGLGYGENNPNFNYGVYGAAQGGIHTNYGIYGTASGSGTNWAGYFNGNVNVTGTLSKGGGSFRIDHPLDPEKKILQHSFVESPDMMNVYNGNVTTDASGFAVVDLPDYFSALNSDFRYQLTVIGQFAQAIVAEKIDGDKFTIQTDKPNVEVSWQVTGIRKDAWAEANRIEVEIDKPAHEQGLYLHPEAFGLSKDRGVGLSSDSEASDQVGRIRRSHEERMEK